MNIEYTSNIRQQTALFCLHFQSILRGFVSAIPVESITHFTPIVLWFGNLLIVSCVFVCNCAFNVLIWVELIPFRSNVHSIFATLTNQHYNYKDNNYGHVTKSSVCSFDTIFIYPKRGNLWMSFIKPCYILIENWNRRSAFVFFLSAVSISIFFYLPRSLNWMNS